MANKERLQNNILAIRSLLDGDNSNLSLFCGFGGITEVLFDPRDSDNADGVFNSLTNVRGLVAQLYGLLESLDEKSGLPKGSHISSIKNSVLTAYHY